MDDFADGVNARRVASPGSDLLFGAVKRDRSNIRGEGIVFSSESADESDDPYGLDELWQDWMGERRPLTAREQALAALA